MIPTTKNRVLSRQTLPITAWPQALPAVLPFSIFFFLAYFYLSFFDWQTLLLEHRRLNQLIHIHSILLLSFQSNKQPNPFSPIPQTVIYYVMEKPRGPNDLHQFLCIPILRISQNNNKRTQIRTL